MTEEEYNESIKDIPPTKTQIRREQAQWRKQVDNIQGKDDQVIRVPDSTIKAQLIGLEAGGFSTEKDKEEFDKLCKGLWGFNKGIVITPLYSKEGELMSFIVDSKKAFSLIKKKGCQTRQSKPS